MKHYNITFRVFCFSILFVLIGLHSRVYGQENHRPLVVTSIKPLAIIAKSAFKDRIAVDYIMPAGLSPHDVVLKVTDIRKLAKADLVVWIGPEFEVRVSKQFANVSKEKRVTAIDLLNLDSDAPAIQGKHDEHNKDDHDHIRDPHIWLSPTIAKQIVDELSQRLKLSADEIFTDSAKKNTDKLLKTSKQGNYVVHHKSFDYFIDAFELQSGLSIRDMLGKQQGAKSQYNLRVEAKKLGVSCVFVEPQHGHKDAVGIAEDLAVPTKTLDILAVGSNNMLPSYENYIYGLATQFASCFAK